MKNLAVPFLLLAITVCQAIRIESVRAEEPDRADVVEARAEAVAKWRAEPYRIEPPDVLSVELKWENFDAVLNVAADELAKDDTPGKLKMTDVKSLESEGRGTRIRAAEVHYQGKFLVGPDGQINIFGLAGVNLAGKTIEQAKTAIAGQLSKSYGVPEVTVDVWAYNSKVVYVIEETGAGDNLRRLKHDGSLRVLDVLADLSYKIDEIEQMYIALERQPKKPTGCLEVDLDALFSNGNDTANYHLIPGDRLFVVMKSGSEEEETGLEKWLIKQIKRETSRLDEVKRRHLEMVANIPLDGPVGEWMKESLVALVEERTQARKVEAEKRMRNLVEERTQAREVKANKRMRKLIEIFK